MQLNEVWREAADIARETGGSVERVARDTYVLDGTEFDVEVAVTLTPRGVARTARNVLETRDAA